jgi:hypothetical protein
MTARFVAAIVVLAGAAAAAAWLGRAALPPDAPIGVLIGLALGAAGAISWILGAAWAAPRGGQAFLAVVVLGILARLVVYSATLIYVALGTGINLPWTAGALLGSYLAFIVLEVLYALRAAGTGAGAARPGSGAEGERE